MEAKSALTIDLDYFMHCGGVGFPRSEFLKRPSDQRLPVFVDLGGSLVSFEVENPPGVPIASEPR